MTPAVDALNCGSAERVIRVPSSGLLVLAHMVNDGLYQVGYTFGRSAH